MDEFLFYLNLLLTNKFNGRHFVPQIFTEESNISTRIFCMRSRKNLENGKFVSIERNVVSVPKMSKLHILEYIIMVSILQGSRKFILRISIIISAMRIHITSGTWRGTHLHIYLSNLLWYWNNELPELKRIVHTLTHWIGINFSKIGWHQLIFFPSLCISLLKSK